VGVGSPESLSEALSTTSIPKVWWAYYLGVHDIENNEGMGKSPTSLGTRCMGRMKHSMLVGCSLEIEINCLPSPFAEFS
jgi:hypothetical protein